MAIVYAALTGIQVAGWGPAWNYFGLLWIVPLFTTFPLFMIMRQWVQHGNADRGRYTNTRVFLVNPFIRYAVFPFGMDYHLPHHIYASVPHYKLKGLHDLLLQDPEYREKGIVVEGYFQLAARRSRRAQSDGHRGAGREVRAETSPATSTSIPIRSNTPRSGIRTPSRARTRTRRARELTFSASCTRYVMAGLTRPSKAARLGCSFGADIPQ